MQPYPALEGIPIELEFSDNNWIAYSKQGENLNSAVYVYGLADKKLHQLTAGYYNDADPVFDPGGKYLFFQTDRRLQPIYSGLDATWIYPNTTQIAYASLDPTAKSLLVARNDEVKIAADTAAAAKPATPEKAAAPAAAAAPAVKNDYC